MKFLQGLPIQRKLTVVLTLNAAIALLIGATGMALYERTRALDDAESELRTTAAMIGANSVAPLVFQDRRSAERTLEGLKADPRVLTGRLFDATGAVFADFRQKAGATMAPQDLEPSEEQLTVEQDRMALYRPIEADGEHVGGILIETDLSGMQAR
jgi:hypothetical protein